MGILQDEIEKETRKVVSKGIKNSERRIRNEALRTRKKMTREWFGKYKANNAVRTIHSDVSSAINGDGLSGSITVDTYYATDEYAGGKKYREWVERHGVGGNAGEYILGDLQLEQGIIGLPAHTTLWDKEHPDEPYNVGRWVNGVNTNFIQQEPLDSYTQDDGKWEEFKNKGEEIISSAIGAE